MFTGIVDHIGELKSVSQTPAGVRLRIFSRFSNLSSGESIAVDGTCLTALPVKEGLFDCELSEETLRLTIASRYVPGSRLNLERAMRLGDRIGGHLVTGHIDQTALVAERRHVGDCVHLSITGVGEENAMYLFKKGSICLQGVSLTVNAVSGASFDVMLIPHTLQRTTLFDLKPQDRVNLEFDWMSKLILNRVKEHPLWNRS